MNNFANQSSIKQILDCYCALGEEHIKIGRSFEYYPCPFWRNPVMSPILITKLSHWQKDLEKVENISRISQERSKYNDKKAYFNILTNGKKKLDKDLIQRLEKLGWSTKPEDFSLNLWTSQIELNIPKGVQIKFGNYFDPDIYPHFLKTLELNFATDKSFMRIFNKMIKLIEPHVTTVLLYKNHKVIGAGLVATKNGGAYLFCGSINKAYRNKNLWKTLAAARQSVSAAKGAKSWITCTRNPHLLWRGDKTFRISVFTKS